jgi:uncharacterized protein
VAPPPALLGLFLAGAILYTSVGHGGATVYLALLVLFGYAAADLVTTVLVLNIVAAAIAFIHFRGAGHVRWNLLWPFLVTSVPGAYLGGRIVLRAEAVELLLGLGLLAAALRFLIFNRALPRRRSAAGRVFLLPALLLGALLGFLAGATGIGGGVFLSPVLVLAGWATVKESAGVAGLFIVINSLAGLAARLPRQPVDDSLLLPLLGLVAVGALVGGFLGARRLPGQTLQILLGLVLLAAVVRIGVGLAA